MQSPKRITESHAAQRAYVDYFSLGPDRSYKKLADYYTSLDDPPTTRESLLKRWSAQYGWNERITRSNQQAIESVEFKERQRWDSERAEWRDIMLDTSKELREKAVEMLRWPIAQKVREIEGVSVTLQPAKWSFADIARMLEVADKSFRLAAEMATDKQEIKIDWKVEVLKQAEAQGLTPEETQIALTNAEARLIELKLLPPPNDQQSA